VAQRREVALTLRGWATALAFLGLAQAAGAATVELMPMVGFEFTGSKDLAGPTSDRLDFKNSDLRGFSIGYLNTENGELEFSWTRAYSSAEIEPSGGLAPDRFDVRIEQLHLNGLYMFDTGAVQPFFLIGAGATRFTPTMDDLDATTRFSFALGGGVKWLWNDHIGLRLDGRWTPAVVYPGTHFFCDATGSESCYSTEANSYISRAYPLLDGFEFTGGLLLRY